jgi:hypothetical protein
MRSEIERVMGQVARVSLRHTTSDPFAGQFAERPIKLLPSFNGEMGLEILYFLARVEPYLRNGWRILARRPALYPAGTAFFDPIYFGHLDQLIVRHGLHPATVGLRRPQQRLDTNFNIQVTRADMEQIALQLRYEMPDILVQESQFELLVRDLFYNYCDIDKRGVIDLDTLLLSCQSSRRNDEFIASRPVLRPSYLPQAFQAPTITREPHIGIQLRAMAKTGKHPGSGPTRDSDPAFVLPLAERAAKHLGLPILIYGRPEGNFLPDGYSHTYEPDIDLLQKELQYLSTCRLMFAPDSGWADLMAWLRVPTMVEGSAYPGHFDDLIGFAPRLRLIDRSWPIEAQIDELLAAQSSIPNDTKEPANHGNTGATKSFRGFS